MACYQQDSDDAFDDQAEDDHILQKEWERAENDIKKSGYRLGLGAGQEETLQEGFDAGYRETVSLAFAIGRLQGQISARLSLIASATSAQGSSDAQLEENLKKLLVECSELLHSVPQMVQAENQQLTAYLPDSLPHANVHTEDQTDHGQLQSDIQTVTRKPRPMSTEEDASLREVIELLSSVRMEDLPPIRDPHLRHCFLNLVQRYRLLLQK